MADELDNNATRRGEIIEVWKTIVGVQMHFNDISMRIRTMFVTILLALFASIGFLLDKGLTLEVGRITVQFATLIPLFGIFGTFLFYFIDRYWYHRLLVGAVKHALQNIEIKYKAELPELALSEAIGAESPYKPRGVVSLLSKLLVRHDKYRGTGQLHSDGKIELFYKSVMLALFLTTIILAWLGGVSVDMETAAPDQPASTAAPVQSPTTLPSEASRPPSPIPVPEVFTNSPAPRVPSSHKTE